MLKPDKVKDAIWEDFLNACMKNDIDYSAIEEHVGIYWKMWMDGYMTGFISGDSEECERRDIDGFAHNMKRKNT